MNAQDIPDNVVAVAKSADFTNDDLAAIWQSDGVDLLNLDYSPLITALRRLKSHFIYDPSKVREHLREVHSIVKRARVMLEALMGEHTKDIDVDQSLRVQMVDWGKQVPENQNQC